MLIDALPKIHGKYRHMADLSKSNWFSVGGAAEVLFRPTNRDDLCFFLKNRPRSVNITTIGVGSNILIRDGGISGVVIKLGSGFTDLFYNGSSLEVGAGMLNSNLVNFCKNLSLSGLEFYVGIPGTVGGALAMNAGAYGSDTESVLQKAEILDMDGNIHILDKKDIGYVYRGNSLENGWIFTKAFFNVYIEDKDKIQNTIQNIINTRESSQPVRSKTGGSTFKNPPNQKAWKLIDESGCRGLSIGGAVISEKHCNFMINLGHATAKDLENLGDEVIKRVYQKTGILLEWEIERIGIIGG